MELMVSLTRRARSLARATAAGCSAIRVPSTTRGTDRGGTRGFSHRFFADKFACAARPGTREVDMHLVFDRCLLEVLGFGGEMSGTVLHFFAAPPDRLVVEAVGSVAVRLLKVVRLAPVGP